MCISSKSCFEDRMRLVAHVMLMSKIFEAIDSAKHVEDYSTHMKKSNSLNKKRRFTLPTVLSTKTKASRNRFLSSLGYRMLSTTVTRKYVDSIVRKSEYDNQIEAFREKDCEELERSRNDYGLQSRKTFY